MRRGERVRLEEAHVNLTPLIDVVFVILIMFIVVAPLLEIDRVHLADGPPLESERVEAAHQKSPITIHVYSDDSLTLNQQPVSLTQLPRYLRLAKRQYPDANPHLFHDRKASFGTYQAIKNAVEGAGFHEMDVLLKPE